MIIDLSDSSEGSFSLLYEKGASCLGGFPAKLVTPVKVTGEFHKEGDSIVVNGIMEYDIEYQCAKCAKQVIDNYRLDFWELYTVNPEDDNQIIEEKIDLTPMVNDYIVLNLKNRVLCSEDCKGLCPHCGTDLNIKTCDCNKSIDDISGDNPFAVLKEIMTGGAEDGSTKK